MIVLSDIITITKDTFSETDMRFVVSSYTYKLDIVVCGNHEVYKIMNNIIKKVMIENELVSISTLKGPFFFYYVKIVPSGDDIEPTRKKIKGSTNILYHNIGQEQEHEQRQQQEGQALSKCELKSFIITYLPTLLKTFHR